MKNVPFKDNNGHMLLPRRAFMLNALKVTGALAVLQLPGRAIGDTLLNLEKPDYSVGDIISIILKEVEGSPFKQTVDTLKSGGMETIVSGIVTTMFATISVIEESAKRNANFIIAHEPTFYNHTDDINWISDNSQIKKKQALLLKYNITVWRFHDYWHACKPDGIQYGFMKKMNWLSYFTKREAPVVIPSVSLKNLVEKLKTNLGIEYIRVMGDPSQSCSRVSVMPGAWGGQPQINILAKEKPDVLIVGELHEWETAEYVRDARQLGSTTALVVLGHAVSEEPGMEWLVDWLKPKIPGIPVSHIASGSPFQWM